MSPKAPQVCMDILPLQRMGCCVNRAAISTCWHVVGRMRRMHARVLARTEHGAKPALKKRLQDVGC